MKDLKKIDKNFANVETKKELQMLDPVTTDVLSVYGLEWFKEDKKYIRCPLSKWDMIKNLAEGLYALVEQPAGSMIAFYSDTTTLKIDVLMGGNFHMAHMAFTGQGGCDLYMGEDFESLKFFRTASFPINNLAYSFTYFENINKKKRLFLINLPLYASVEKISIGVDQDAKIEKANLFEKGKIVCYGTSITQGGCASRPGMCYTNILSRRTGYEVMNFGFSGNGRGQKEIAEMLSEIKDVKMFILDYEANATLDMLKNTLDDFIDTLRMKYKEVPIIVLSKVRMSNEYHFEANKKAQQKSLNFQKQTVKKHQANDKNIYFIDGHKLIGDRDTECSVDGAHLTDLGFYKFALKLEKYIEKIIK